MSFESDNIVMTKNVFMSKNYYSKGLFIPNVVDIFKENVNTYRRKF